MPILSSLEAIPYLFNSPIKSDLFFVSTKQSLDNKWATKSPLMMRDEDFGVLRLRAFGTFSFRIDDPAVFMKEVFGSQQKVKTWDIVQFFVSLVNESFSEAVSELKIPALDLISEYKSIGEAVKDKANTESINYGVQFTKINIENISLPDEVEKLIDEQSGLGLASKDMNTYAQYQSVRAMRDSASQDTGFAGLGAGFAFANQIKDAVSSPKEEAPTVDIYEEITKYKKLLDSGAITEEEFNTLKAKILK